MEQNTARNFALQLGSLATLYISLSALVAVAFGVVDVVYPDAATYAWEYTSAQSSIRFGAALLIVFFPAFIVLTRLVQHVRRKEQGVYLSLTKWVVYLSLFVGGMILLGDFVSVVYNYLNGELTTRFLFKAFVLGLVLTCALYYYLKDAQGYWTLHERASKLYGVGVATLVVSALAFAFAYGDSPTKVREMRLDETQISNLSDMQWRIEDHYNVKNELPKTVEEIYKQTGISKPEAPKGREGYVYEIVDEDTYKLCATFAHPSLPSEFMQPAYSGLTNPYSNWDHGEGKTCFERTVIKTEMIKPL